MEARARVKAEVILCAKFRGGPAQFSFESTVRKPEPVSGVCSRHKQEDAGWICIGRNVPVRFAPALRQFTPRASRGLTYLMIAGGMGDGIETPQEICAIAGEVRVILRSPVQKVQSAIDGRMTVLQRGRMQCARRRNRSKKTTEQETHGGIIAKWTCGQEGAVNVWNPILRKMREGWAPRLGRKKREDFPPAY